MLTVANVLERAKSRSEIGSWYRLARTLGTSDNIVSRWRKGDGAPNDEMALKLAELAQLPPGHVLAAAHASRYPEGSPVRAAWEMVCIMSTKARRALGGRRLAFA